MFCLWSFISLLQENPLLNVHTLIFLILSCGQKIVKRTLKPPYEFGTLYKNKNLYYTIP